MVVKRNIELVGVFLLLSFFFLFLGIVWVFLASPVKSGSRETVEVEIQSGTSVRQISSTLKDLKLIHSKLLFMVYIKLNHVSSLKAGFYQFQHGMSLSEIVDTLEKGSTYRPDLVVLTFKEGERITDYAKTIEKGTNHSYDEVIDVFQNKEYLKSLISKYWFLSDDILNPNIYYALEGYLAPDTYHFDDKDVDVKNIIEAMLDENLKELTPYRQVLDGKIHYYLTMASIVELEGTNTENRKMIVGIFNNRLSSGMNLGSDVTTYYGLQAAMNSDLTSEEFASVNQYNTRSVNMIGKMPVGPICNPSLSSIEASINPTDNDYLFFVADKNGNIFYTKTNAEHDKKVAEIKAKGDWIW